MGTNITGIGNANAIGFKSRVTGGAYFPPELKDALVGVWSAYGKSNDSTDRNIIKNKIKDRGGDFVISNAAYEGMSGYNGYPVVFGANKTWDQMPTGTFTWNIEDNKLHITKALIAGNGLLFSYVKLNGSLLNVKEIPSFKIKVSGLEGKSKLWYRYLKTEDAISETIAVLENGTHELPKSYIPSDSLHNGVWVGFTVTPISEGVKEFDCDITIEVLPEYEGAFVTDGVDDLITSTKTVQEMGITDEITVVSMIHKISSDNNWTNLIGELKEDHTFVANRATNTDKTGIYGYTYNYVGDAIVINNILGDKNDYIVRTSTSLGLDNKYYVTGFRSAGIIQNISQIAWYWTFIANRVLTEDEINLVIEKYNLDRPGEIVKPQVYYNIKKQKISNDNHSAFDDKLIDYSGNGYDAKLYNFGWKEDSGIGKYETDFTDWKKSFKVTSFDSESIKFTSDVSWVLLYHPSSIGEDIPSFKVRIKLYGKGTLYYNYITQEGKYTNVAVKSEIFETPICYNTKYTGEKGVNVGFTLGVISGECSGTITQIPEYENALVFDGIDDYGKVTGLPILKDYTVAADYIRTFAKENAQDSPILSKSKVAGSGAFLFNYLNADSITSSYSFGTNNILKEINDSERKIYYLSKYASDGHNVNAGSAVDYDTMWLGTYRDNISNFFTGALYFAMLFPYSLSEFLLERQIKKARAGTLYSNQVEFRPIIPEDENITKIDYFVVDSGTWTVIKPGDYVDVGARIVLNVYTKLPYKIAGASSTAFTGMTVGPSTALNIWDVKGYIKDKTPQKIKLTLAVNEDIIQWNPTISANIPDSYDAVTEWFANGWETKIAVDDWIKKSDRIFFKLKLKEPLHEIGKVTFGGSECQATKASNWSESNNLWEIVTYSSVGDLSQVFNVQVDEYIRYEDIVQPYPSIINLVSIDKTHFYTYGDKLKVGDVILYNSYKNLLKGLYSLNGQLKYNGVYIYDIDGRITVAKEMVFSWTVSPAWLFDNNEPKCILSPSRLRIPNSSYKILGYIPDISGHGNNGKINNSAYEGMSGVNGYPVVFGKNKTWANESNGYVTNITSNTIHITNVLNAGLALLYSYVKYNGNLQNIKEIPPFKIEIKGLEGRSKFIYKYLATSDATKETNLYLGNGTHELPKSFLPTEALINNAVVGFSISPIEEGVTNFLSDITIKVLPEYEGAYCLDGVDDFVTIPTTVGGKQILMKVNWNSLNHVLYDQRNNVEAPFCIVTASGTIAYNQRNVGGNTYIDGILNNHILVDDLQAITHNIVLNNDYNVANSNSFIGTNYTKSIYAKMSLYDFMLFDEISTDDKIKELNEYVGIEGNVFEFNPTFTIDLPMAIKSIKVYQGGNEISPGYLYPNKDTEFEVYVSLNDGKYAVDTITVDGVEITKDRVVGEYNIFKFTLNGSSEQKITIHSYEYIMYEDINQPYPVIFKVKDRTTNQIYSWGDRIKIGSSIQLIHGENPNLLPELYSIISYTYEGNSYSYNQLTNLVITVTKTISVSCQKTWKLGSNEPKCILSPKRLKLANSSYKYLGYIPDISGNGNNGVFNNFAFSGMSGANGYTYEYTNTSDFSVLSQYARTINSEKIEFFGYINAVTFYRKNPTYKGKIKIEGLTSAISSGKVQHFQIYTNSKTNTETFVFKTDGVYDIDVTGIGDATNVYFYVLPANTSESGTLDNPITIEQVGNYEGAICFDGIDDYVTIPTLSKGGKQVLMKVNWNTINSIIYDQRGSGGFAIYCSDYNNPSDPITVPAYKGRNAAGTTYIDGIRNEYIIASQLRNVTHNIVEILDTSYAAGNINPIIGKSYLNANYGKMSLYDFVLFDEVSTDEEIKQLNDIIGIEGDYVQKPDYYWDAYGKSNFDADRGYIKDLVSLQQANSLENFNFAYDKMSGYGGYSFKSFNDSQDSWNIRGDGTGVEIISRDGYSMTVKKLVQNLDWQISNNEYRYPTVLNKELPFKCKSNKKVGLIWQLKYKTEGATSDTAITLINQQLTPNVPLEINLPYKTQDELTELGAVSTSVYYLLYFSNTTLEIGEEYTVEMLPLYPNGLVLDGVDDYSENASIPLLSDYTYIFKRTLLNKKYNSASIFKGSNKQSGRGAFICDYNSVEPDLLTQGFSFGAGLYVDSLNADSIVYGTRGSVNGTEITAGSNTDTEGLTVGKWRAYKEMVFYKLFLYPRTVNMLSINMVKNMMEEDGIIDLTSKLFTDKYTGDFYEMDFNNDFLIGN